MSALAKRPCLACSGAGSIKVHVPLPGYYPGGRYSDVKCPRCSGTGQVDCCERCGDDEPETHICKLVCGFLLPAECQLCEQEIDLQPGSFTPHEHGSRPFRVLCGAGVPGAVTLGERWWARCEAHGGLDAADDARRAELQAERRETAALERFAAGTACADCGSRTDADPCPLCGKIVCQLCAEREGSFCCPPAPPAPIEPTAPQVGPIVIDEPPAPPPTGQLIVPDPPPITSKKRRRKKSPTSAPAIARRQRGPSAPELPGIPDHHDAPWCGCDRCWGGA